MIFFGQPSETDMIGCLAIKMLSLAGIVISIYRFKYILYTNSGSKQISHISSYCTQNYLNFIDINALISIFKNVNVLGYLEVCGRV